jgi:hypothetical protein
MSRFIALCLSLGLFLAATLTSQANDTPPPFIGHPACAGVSLSTPMTPDCAALIAARQVPNVTQLPLDYGLLSDVTLIRFNKAEVPLYNAPNGAVVETLASGYMYVAPYEFREGFARIGGGRWVNLEDARFARPSDYRGVTINGPLEMPFAWVLWGHDASLAPAGLSDRENGRYERFQLVNIFATVNVRGWNWYLVGEKHWINQKNLSLVYPNAPAAFSGNWVGVNLYEQNIVAYSGGTPVMAALVSSGVKNGEWDTRTGTFSVHTRVEAGTMNGREGLPDFYSLELVPYAQYFDQLISLHGTYWHDSFGYPHSHGCVNLSVTDAKWLFSFIDIGSTVYVY